MELRLNQSTPSGLEQSFAQLSPELQALMRQYPDMMGKLEGLTKQEGLAKLQDFLKRMSEVIGEQAKAAEIMRLVLEEQQLLQTLRKLKLQDIEQAHELVKSAQQHLDQADLQNMQLAQAVAVAAVSTAFLPVSLPKPETPKHVSDGRSSATNHLQRMRDFAN